MGKESIKLVANNKKAYHDYFIDDKFEAGIELFGTEVKSIRMGKWHAHQPLREGQYLQQGPAAGAKALTSPQRDHEA